MKYGIYIIGLLLFWLAACKKDPEFTVEIDAELQPYVDLFIAEADSRGITVDFTTEGLSAKILTINNNTVAGNCFQRDDDNNELTIDPQFWESFDDQQKELLIFHELGHCYLKLEHDDRRDSNGNCLSIMRSNDLVCNMDNYDTAREYFVDELFNK